MYTSTYWFNLAAKEECNFVAIARYMVMGLECLKAEMDKTS